MIHERFQEVIDKERDRTAAYSRTVRVCLAASCKSSRSDQVLKAIKDKVKSGDEAKTCEVKGVGCLGLCSRGPLVAIDNMDGDQSIKTLYQDVTPERAPELVTDGGKAAKDLVCPSDLPFFAKQKKIVLKNSGLIDPERIEEYIAAGGYQTLYNIVTDIDPSQVVDEIVRSGLRGRGGGGYPTGLKWTTVAKSEAVKTKYVICNADEGDPGAFMDRSVLESDPHRVLEGMALAGFAVGATKGYIYVRGEYPLAIARLKKAINQAKRFGVLGTGICGTTVDFMVEIRLGAGAFVCGEETALIASIEGRRGQPRPRPPYPAEFGLWGEPTLINNVETFANIVPILQNGADWFSRIGTDKSKGTKVFALAGNVENTGLIEVPMGMTLSEIVNDIAGGVPGGRPIKAVQTGGPSGGCIPTEHFEAGVGYNSLQELGSIMGSGGMIVMDDTNSMVDVARYFMEFCMSESCGRCVPCRVGTVQMHELLDRIYEGEASSKDLALLEELCTVVSSMSLCGLGMTAPNPVRSTLRYFRNEYLDRLVDHNGSAEPETVQEAS